MERRFFQLRRAAIGVVIMVVATVCLSVAARAAKRVALIIGIGQYTQLQPLVNPVRDARAMAALMRQHGFAVSEFLDVDLAGFESALKTFAVTAKDADEAVVFYAGHGMTAIKDRQVFNALAPTDAAISCKTRIAERTLSMQQLLKAIENVPKQVVLFDACRSDPFRGCRNSSALDAALGFGFQQVRLEARARRMSRSPGREMAVKGRGARALNSGPGLPPRAVLVAYSTHPGASASDGRPGTHSPFAEALLAALAAGPRTPIRKVLDQVSTRVARTSTQNPWVVTQGGEPRMCLAGTGCEEREVLSARKALLLAQAASDAVAKGDEVTGILLALEALPDRRPEGQQPLISQVVVSLDAALRANRLKVELRVHEATIFDAAYSPDGKWIVTASGDNTARVWDVATGQEIAVLIGHSDDIHSATFSPEGRLIATASEDGTARIWDRVTGKELHRLLGDGGPIYKANFSPDGTLIATVEGSGDTRIWDVATGKMRARLRGGWWFGAFSPNGRSIVTAFARNNAQVWNVPSGTGRVQLKGHKSYIRSVAWSPDGSLIVTASDDRTARIWDAASGREIFRLRGHGGEVNNAAFSPDGKLIVTASQDNTARIWDVKTGAELAALNGHTGWVNRAVFSPDGKLIVTASADRTARVWNVENGSQYGRPLTHAESVERAIFSPDGTAILTMSPRLVRIWRKPEGRARVRFVGHKSWLRSARFSPDGRLVVTASDDGTARIWNRVSGKEVRRLKGHGGRLRSAAFSPDGKLVVTGSADKTALVWDWMSGKVRSRLNGHGNELMGVTFSPDGKSIATASSDNTVRLWDAATGRTLAKFLGHCPKGARSGGNLCSLSSPAYSPDGKTLVTASSKNSAQIWDVVTGRERTRLEGHGGEVRSAAFSPDGSLIVTASDDRTARIWDALTGKERLRLEGHAGWVLDAAWSPDGKSIVTASWDGTARVWDVAGGTERARIAGHSGPVWSARFSPDGKSILTASSDGTARIWDAPYPTNKELVAEARRVVPRCLTRRQRKSYGLAQDPPAWCVTRRKWPYDNGLGVRPETLAGNR